MFLTLALFSTLGTLMAFVEGFRFHDVRFIQGSGIFREKQHRHFSPRYLHRPLHMAVLKTGDNTPLRWDEAKQHIKYVREHGVEQFLRQYQKSKHLICRNFKWGDEIEVGILRKDEKTGHFDLSCRAPEIREELNAEKCPDGDKINWCVYQPEYGSWMVESIPSRPYEGGTIDLLDVEKNMNIRRKRLLEKLRPDEIIPYVSNFPMLGVAGYAHSEEVRGPIANSAYISDHIINPHPRFGTLTQNIRMRRNENVNITCRKTEDGASDLHMDAMAFGMGCNCLQITMQVETERKSRYLHDQLTVMSPILLALSASSPLFKGHLTNKDCRWSVISQAVDDRTRMERGETTESENIPDPDMVGGGVKRLSKSRYSSVSRYIGKAVDADEENIFEDLNDIDAEENREATEYLMTHGVDKQLARHIGHMFVRDPLCIYQESIELDDDIDHDHFENIQGTNWRTMRWKMPSIQGQNRCPGEDSQAAGWRVEFRPYEAQITDFENAAYSIFVVLLSRAILAMNANFYMPLSYVESNMEKAENIDAVIKEKFWVNKHAFMKEGGDKDFNWDHDRLALDVDRQNDLIELSLDEIINGDEGRGIRGLVGLITEYLNALGCDSRTQCTLLQYMDLLKKRASGELPTAANFIRNFVKSHQKQPTGETQLHPEVIDDLLLLCADIGNGNADAMTLIGHESSKKEVRESRCGKDMEGMKNRNVLLDDVPGTYVPVSICTPPRSVSSSDSRNENTLHSNARQDVDSEREVCGDCVV